MGSIIAIDLPEIPFLMCYERPRNRIYLGVAQNEIRAPSDFPIRLLRFSKIYCRPRRSARHGYKIIFDQRIKNEGTDSRLRCVGVTVCQDILPSCIFLIQKMILSVTNIGYPRPQKRKHTPLQHAAGAAAEIGAEGFVQPFEA